MTIIYCLDHLSLKRSGENYKLAGTVLMSSTNKGKNTPNKKQPTQQEASLQPNKPLKICSKTITRRLNGPRKGKI